MKHIVNILILSLLSLAVYAQPQQAIGLACVASNESPMIFNINLQRETATYFDLARNTWVSFTYVETRLNEIVLMPRSPYGKSFVLRQSRGWQKVHVDRTTLEWFTQLTVDLDRNDGARRGNCSVHNVNEIRDVAKIEYDRLNNIRAF